MPLVVTDTMITEASARYSTPPGLLKAMCIIESSMRPWAYNPEPKYIYFWDIKRNAPFRRLTATEVNSKEPPTDFPSASRDVPRDAEWWGQQASWGVLQVMGAVARELGFRGDFLTELSDPEICLDLGARHLQNFFIRWGSWEKAIASYNAGSPRRNQQGQFVNQGYLDKVKRQWEQLKAAP